MMATFKHLSIIVGLLCSAMPVTAGAQTAAPAGALQWDAAGYLHNDGVDVLVFSNWYDGLFADSKISGVEIVHQGVRTATNGDVRLSATPGQWDPTARLVNRTVDARTGTVEVTLEYPDPQWRYVVRVEPRGKAAAISVSLDRPVPRALEGKAGFNLEFLPPAYLHKSFMADGRPGTFPLHPADAMVRTPERNAASGRSEGPGAEPMPLTSGNRLVLAPEDPGRRVTLRSEGVPIQLFDGRNQAQNGWFVARSLLPAGRTGRVLEWTVEANSVPGWLRAPVIAHSQLGYAPAATKIAAVELDRGDSRPGRLQLLRVGEDGAMTPVAVPASRPWGNYLRYRYVQLDFSTVRAPGTYLLDYAGTRTATFRIADDVYADAWHPTNDVYFPVAMDHMAVNEAYRVWHGPAHLDDARQAPVDHEHIDLYRQGPTTDTTFKPGEHIPGLNVGGWFDAGDFDIRTQSQYQVVRQLVAARERWTVDRDTVSVDDARRQVEIHVPDGIPDIVQQVRHGTLQLVAQFDAVGHAINGIVEPDVAEYTHLGDAGSKTDRQIYDPQLKPGQERNGRSGVPDDRWAFTSKASALNYGSIAALAAASRVLAGYDDALARKARGIAERVWTEEHGHAPDLFRHGNTTGGPVEEEEFAAAVELLKTTGERRYAERVAALWPAVAPHFASVAWTAASAIPSMPASYRAAMVPAVRRWQADADAAASANPFGVPITTGGWAGSGTVMNFALNSYILHKEFPGIVDGRGLQRGIDFLLGHHPASDVSFVSGVGTVSKEVGYGNNRADFSYIAGGVVPGVLIIKPDLPENHEDWPFFWGENEYVIPEGSMWIMLANAAREMTGAKGGATLPGKSGDQR
jgi:endoglucanase